MTDKQTEAMKLALEALEPFTTPNWAGTGVDKANEAITALREALNAPLAKQPAQQKPVATLWQHGETGRTRITMPEDITDCDARWFKAADLYTSPPTLSLAQRTWVGLTEQEAFDCFSPNPVTHSKNVEAKLKEKNT